MEADSIANCSTFGLAGSTSPVVMFGASYNEFRLSNVMTSDE